MFRVIRDKLAQDLVEYTLSLAFVVLTSGPLFLTSVLR
jgi:hypothetical protein